MLELGDDAAVVPLAVEPIDNGWEIRDDDGQCRMRIDTSEPPIKEWPSGLAPESPESLVATVYPDGRTAVPMMDNDQFFPGRVESMILAIVERDGVPHRAAFSFHAEHNERFVGTGERFADMDLAGQTLLLENTDALGNNNRRAYKNVPFYMSSRPYGLFMHTSSHVRLSLADISTRAAQGVIAEPTIDLFVIGGGSVPRVLHNYQSLTGFPHATTPLWSFGTWMSRMTYFTAEEVRNVGQKLRDGDFPCDVLHLDTGWFAKDWVCEWQFGEDNFPDPPGFAREMLEKGFRMTLWQNPNIGEGNKLLEDALAKRYLPPRKDLTTTGSDFSDTQYAGQIDFSNPDAVEWYKEQLLRPLLEMGYAAIKTDFGEQIAMNAEYMNLPAEKLHNLYALLYQKAAYEITQDVRGEGIIWARASWAGCQRYPLHWAGDTACTWDGLAAALKGGLHFGLSGFAFWSHDVPGFHGLPNFMYSWPADDLYVRWTQFGVFSSHLRYHGTSPREPYEYPAVADIVRKWLKLRYCLIPYIVDEADKAVATGRPILQAMVLQHEDDPTCWHVDDQYCFGESFLVAPIMNSQGRRDIYLPAGRWVDFWSGETLQGPTWLKDVEAPLDRMPVFARANATVRVYPEAVACTDEMNLDKAVTLTFDEDFASLGQTVVGEVTGL
jgi:alpha-D-xyloside xylohydrolase